MSFALEMQKMTNVIAVMRPRVPELRADGRRAVGLALDAAAQLTACAVLLAAPDVLGVLESLGLRVRGEVVVVGREVFKQSRFVLLGARRARSAAVHEDGELTALRDARAALGLGVTCHDAREGDMNVKPIDHIADTVKQNLRFLPKIGSRVERL